MPDFDALEALLDEHVTDSRAAIGEDATCSGIQAAVRDASGGVWSYATGWSTLEGEPENMKEGTPVDLASLTKPMATATLLFQAIDEGLAHWSTPVSKVIDWWPGGRVRTANLRDLCVHLSGLPDWEPLYDGLSFDPAEAEERSANVRQVERRIQEVEPESTPGEEERYSDLGYIALARCLEELFDASFETLVEGRVLEPLGLTDTRFVATHRGDGPLEGAMATEQMDDRGGVVRGYVHDRNCSVMGGVAGHAGLFGTARDVLSFAEHMLKVDGGDGSGIVSPETLEKAWSPPNRVESRRHRGGWDTPSGEQSSAGRGFASREVVGHLGFTGTSMWLDRTDGVIAVLLTNRVYPTRENERIKPLRVAFHEAVLPPE